MLAIMGIMSINWGMSLNFPYPVSLVAMEAVYRIILGSSHGCIDGGRCQTILVDSIPITTTTPVRHCAGRAFSVPNWFSAYQEWYSNDSCSSGSLTATARRLPYS